MTLLALAVLPGMLLLMGVPIFAVLIAATLGGILLSINPVQAIHSAMFGSLDIFPLLAVPLFIYAGDIMSRGGIARRLIDLILSMIGAVRGALGIATIAACEVFSVMSGSSVACVAAIGKTMIPALQKNGYGTVFSVSLVTATGVVDVITPPSITMIIYGIVAQQSVPQLFLAGFPAGILIGVALAIYVVWYARVKKIPVTAPAERRGVRAAAKDAIWSIFAPVVIFGGIYGGLFTPTEGAAVGAAATLIASVAMRQLSLEGLKKSFYGTAESTGMIFMIFLGADMLNAALALSQMPAQLADAVAHSGLPPMMVIVAILLFYVCLGAVMDELSMILLTVPILFPSVMGLELHGLDPTSKAIWFGILVLCVVEFGLIAPPVGLNVYVVNSFARDVPMAETYRGVIPFLIADVLRVALLMTFPWLSLWLVSVLT